MNFEETTQKKKLLRTTRKKMFIVLVSNFWFAEYRTVPTEINELQNFVISIFYKFIICNLLSNDKDSHWEEFYVHKEFV